MIGWSVGLGRLLCRRYSEISDQKEFFDITRESDNVVVHFYRPVSKVCLYMHKHLEKLAKKHIECRFVKINAEKATFLCERPAAPRHRVIAPVLPRQGVIRVIRQWGHRLSPRSRRQQIWPCGTSRDSLSRLHLLGPPLPPPL